MTYVHAGPQVRDIGGYVTLTVPRPVLAAVLADVAHTAAQDPVVAALWDDLGRAASDAQDDGLTPAERERCAEDVAAVARDLLDRVCLDDGIELAWPAAVRWVSGLVDVAETALRRRYPDTNTLRLVGGTR